MKIATFPCPYCSAPLRIRDRAFVDREVGCPDCGGRIEITLDRDQEPVARKIVNESSEKPPLPKLPPRKSRSKIKTKPKSETGETSPAGSVRASRRPPGRWSRRFSGVLLSPVGIAWAVAGLVGLMLLILAWPAGESADSEPPTNPSADSTDADPPDRVTPVAPDEIVLPEAPERMPAGDEDVVADRLRQLSEELGRYVAQRGHFPSGTVAIGEQPVTDRFSWLAELSARRAAGRRNEPQWNQPWRDPLNDRFVRQQQEMFLNPLIPRKVGADRYPATHFVGIAGVGADAPTLPVNHRRAGIFGIHRTARPEDVKDGLAHTMMVAGVQEQLGSWAAGGSATVRAFTQEPYFDGPDGFGTGEAGGMSVLMADGSVRFLSKNTAPVIVRRMAAMADGWPLDEAVPGEPGQVPPSESQPIEPPVVAEVKPQPQNVEPEDPPAPAEAERPMEPAEPPVDIPAALAVKIVKFEQIKNVPFQELLYQLEEMCGVPIRPDDKLPPADAEFWIQPVSLSLQNATVRQILEALLKKAELTFTVEPDHIQLHAAE